jgi:hypothetical protein
MPAADARSLGPRYVRGRMFEAGSCGKLADLENTGGNLT